MAQLDVTKPLQLNDGTPVVLTSKSRNILYVAVPRTHPLGTDRRGRNPGDRHFRLDGTREAYLEKSQYRLQNVPEAPKPRTVNKLTPLARTVLDYLQSKGDASPLEATLDLGVNSGSFTRRITELRRAGYPITDENRKHPITGRQYKRYFYKLDS